MTGRVRSLLILAVVAAGTATWAHATDFTVGDSQGWTSGVDYDTWASDKTFLLGDSLVFQYTSLHSVDEVGASDFSSCSSSNAIQSFTDQNTTITLTQPGAHYFICGTPAHCSNGMKLAINVSSASAAAAGGGGSPSSSSPTPPTTTPSDSTPLTSPETPSTQPTTSSDSTPTTTSKSTPTTSGTPSSSRALSGGFIGKHGLLVGGLILGLGLGLMG